MPASVKGGVELRKALRKFAPDLGKETQKEIAGALKPITKTGIGYKTSPSKPNRRGFRSLARVFNKTAAGAIYETMGRKTPSSRFVQNQNGKFGAAMKGDGKMEGRALYRAYEENQGKARESVLNAIKTAADKLNATAKARG
jgi:hypothetical protein